MTRETKTIETTSGKKVVINAYLTGPESNQIKIAMFEGLEVDAPEVGEKMAKIKIPLSATIKREPKLLEISILSVDDEQDQKKALQIVQQMPEAEYADLIKKIDAIHKGPLVPAK